MATLTEIYHFLRLLYVKLGTQYCPDCNVPIEPQTVDSIVAGVMRDYRNMRIGFLAPLDAGSLDAGEDAGSLDAGALDAGEDAGTGDAGDAG